MEYMFKILMTIKEVVIKLFIVLWNNYRNKQKHLSVMNAVCPYIA